LIKEQGAPQREANHCQRGITFHLHRKGQRSEVKRLTDLVRQWLNNGENLIKISQGETNCFKNESFRILVLRMPPLTAYKSMSRKFWVFQKELILDGVSTNREEPRGHIRFERTESGINAHTVKSQYMKYADLNGQWRTEWVEQEFTFPGTMYLSQCLNQTIVKLYGNEQGYNRFNFTARNY
jgi:hypothetical protein